MLKDFETFVRIVALLVGASWAYFKFVKGRIFSSRLEPTVEGKSIRKGAFIYLHMSMKLKNVGLSKVKLSQKGTALTIKSAPSGSSEEVLTADWEQRGTFPIFQEHEWIEPGETIGDNQVVVVPSANNVVFRLEVRISGQGTYWTANGLVDVEGEKSDDIERKPRIRKVSFLIPVFVAALWACGNKKR